MTSDRSMALSVGSCRRLSWLEDGSGNPLGNDFDPATPSAARDDVSLTFLTLTHLGTSGLTDIVFTTSYDAAGRPLVQDFPEGQRIQRLYNAAGALDGVRVDRGTGSGWQNIATDFTYDARGKLLGHDLANGLRTEHTYDADLERLLRVHTHDPATSDPAFQDLHYAYDPAGNPVQVRDATINPTFASNQLIPNTRTFFYDPRYRLVRAQGRKLKSVVPGSQNPLEASPAEGDYQAYDLRYAYDEVGNFRLNHEVSRKPIHFKTDAPDLHNGPGDEAIDGARDQGNWRYDANGNATHTPRQDTLGYSFDSQPVYVDMGGGTEVRYRRHADQRVLRLVKKNGVRALGVYLGPWEYHERVGTGAAAKVVLHVDGAGRHAQVEVVLSGTDASSLPVFYVHSDHLGSGHVLTDASGGLLSQEEFLPYGRSSDRRDARNRYRFIGVERDEDTGLCMTGPRTYDPVSGRFLQADPVVQARSPFEYASSNPIGRSDTNGYQDQCTILDAEYPPGEQAVTKSSIIPGMAAVDEFVGEAAQRWVEQGTAYTPGGALISKGLELAAPYAPEGTHAAVTQVVDGLVVLGDIAIVGAAMRGAGRGLATAAPTTGMPTRRGLRGALTLPGSSPAKAAPTTTMIGRMKDLERFADDASIDTWAKSGRIPGPGDKPVTWAENLKWLKERVARGDKFGIATDPATLPPVVGGYIPGTPNGYFTARELQALRAMGVEPVPMLGGAP